VDSTGWRVCNAVRGPRARRVRPPHLAARHGLSLCHEAVSPGSPPRASGPEGLASRGRPYAQSHVSLGLRRESGCPANRPTGSAAGEGWKNACRAAHRHDWLAAQNLRAYAQSKMSFLAKVVLLPWRPNGFTRRRRVKPAWGLHSDMTHLGHAIGRKYLYFKRLSSVTTLAQIIAS
jgi:hypothetical protein